LRLTTDAARMSLNFGLLTIPEENGQTMAIPPLAEYRALVARNCGLNGKAPMAATTLASFASSARQEALAAARDYTIMLGLNPGPTLPPGAPIIASGHQPQSFHPGVMIKIAALTRAAGAAGAIPLFITVDSDEFRAENAATPIVKSGRLEKLEYPLFPSRRHGLYETTPAEPLEDTLSRMEAMARFMDDGRLSSPRKAIDEFRIKLSGARLDFPDYTSRAIAMRRAWLAPQLDNFLEAPVSILAQGSSFLRFAGWILSDIGRFAACYNGALEEYRRQRKLRYPANPFPNLEMEDGRIQAPFWALGPAGRQKLFVAPGAGEPLPLRLEDGRRLPMAALAEGSLRIRPKAITLSLYMRLLLCDLFIHGVGGAKYDHVTDRLMEEYFKVTPPDYACVSATLWPGVAAVDPRPEIERIGRALRAMEQHPEVAGADDPQIPPLAAEKGRLVVDIKAPGADKKLIGARISELNRLMAGCLTAQRRSLEMELEELIPLEKERQVAQDREYPYFLYSKKDFLDLSVSLGA